MTEHCRSVLALSTVVWVFATGCGGTNTVVCEPACPAGLTCTAQGCVPDGSGADLASGASDLARTCAPACAGATPYCNASAVCVPCLEDAHCPTGQICKSLGQGQGMTSACIPGCTDNDRCGGAGKQCCAGQCVDTSKDSQNCGACGNKCSGINARVQCTAGQCTVGACNAGWGDCNMNGADGCETNLRADPKNCTACGMACKLDHAIADCSNGCRIRACDFGWDDCDGKEPNGCELSVSANNSNCGACGNACPLVPHAKNNCINGSCQLISCDAGYADCDGMRPNGCEISTVTDASNCGACGNKCGPGLICAQSLCTCPQCVLPNAKSTCVNLKCQVAQCNINFGDCDGQPQNGCELNLVNDARNCGQCGLACAQGLVCVNGSCTCPNCVRANAKTACINNMCVLDSCFPGFGNCNNNDADGCEADFSIDNANCGGCGKPCPNGNTCLAGVCQAFRTA